MAEGQYLPIAKAQAKNRATFPTDPAARKALPVFSGVLAYFPDAIVAVAAVSKAGNDQHNPGQPLHWNRAKSTDEADTCVRHLMDEQVFDSDHVRHRAKAAWRALALLQKEMEADGLGPLAPLAPPTVGFAPTLADLKEAAAKR